MLLVVQDGIVTSVAERLSDFKYAKAILSPFLRPTVDTSDLEIFYLMDLWFLQKLPFENVKYLHSP